MRPVSRRSWPQLAINGVEGRVILLAIRASAVLRCGPRRFLMSPATYGRSLAVAQRSALAHAGRGRLPRSGKVKEATVAVGRFRISSRASWRPARSYWTYCSSVASTRHALEKTADRHDDKDPRRHGGGMHSWNGTVATQTQVDPRGPLLKLQVGGQTTVSGASTCSDGMIVRSRKRVFVGYAMAG